MAKFTDLIQISAVEKFLLSGIIFEISTLDALIKKYLDIH